MNERIEGWDTLVYTPGKGPPQALAPKETILICNPPLVNGPPLSPLHESLPSLPAQITLRERILL